MTNPADADAQETRNQPGEFTKRKGRWRRKIGTCMRRRSGGIDVPRRRPPARRRRRRRRRGAEPSQLHGGAAAEQRIGVGGEVTPLLMAGGRRRPRGEEGRMFSSRLGLPDETKLCSVGWVDSLPLSVPRSRDKRSHRGHVFRVFTLMGPRPRVCVWLARFRKIHSDGRRFALRG
jgi:hypothetical protein